MLSKVGLAFESVDKILKCDHSNESYFASEQYFTVLVQILFFKGLRMTSNGRCERKYENLYFDS